MGIFFSRVMSAVVHTFQEKETGTGQLIVACPQTKKCAIIDAVLNYNPASGEMTTTSADELLSFCAEKGYEVEWILDTHVHADHITAMHYLKNKTNAKRGIGEHVKQVQDTFREMYNLPESFCEGSFWDSLWKDGDTFSIGDMKVHVLNTPGHTPADVSYYIENDCVIVGDSIFMPDLGTARCDFPGGSVDVIWESIEKLKALPKDTRMFVGHDYPSGREFSVETSVTQQLETNKHVKLGTPKEEFVKTRSERDATLGTPRLLHPSLQFNIRGGVPPPSGFVVVPLKGSL